MSKSFVTVPNTGLCTNPVGRPGQTVFFHLYFSQNIYYFSKEFNVTELQVIRSYLSSRSVDELNEIKQLIRLAPYPTRRMDSRPVPVEVEVFSVQFTTKFLENDIYFAINIVRNHCQYETWSSLSLGEGVKGIVVQFLSSQASHFGRQLWWNRDPG